MTEVHSQMEPLSEGDASVNMLKLMQQDPIKNPHTDEQISEIVRHLRAKREELQAMEKKPRTRSPVSPKKRSTAQILANF